MSIDMLGGLIQKLRGECIPTLTSLIEKLAGRRWRRTLRELKKFVREEPCWVSLVDATKFTFVASATTTIAAIRTLSVAAFATTAEDTASPFGLRDLLVALKSWATKRFRVQGYDLHEGMIFAEMIEAAGGEGEIRSKHLFTRDQIRVIVDRQAKGEVGLLYVNGRTNFFFTLAEDGTSLAVVRVGWLAHYGFWGVWSDSASYGSHWPAGNRLFLSAA